MRDPEKLSAVSRKVDGITIIGRYTVSHDGLLTVVSPYGRKATRLGGLTPRSLAGLLLNELVQRKSRPELSRAAKLLEH